MKIKAARVIHRPATKPAVAARPLTPAQKYAKAKGYPPVPKWALDLPPDIIESRKFIIWKYDQYPEMATPLQKMLDQDKSKHSKLKGYKSWWVFEVCERRMSADAQRARIFLGNVYAKDEQGAITKAKAFFPEKRGHMELETYN